MKLLAWILVAVAAAALSLGAFRLVGGSQASPVQTSYYANGQVEIEAEVRNGRREGRCRRFYADGSRLAEGRYAAGKMQGEWSFWHRDGSVDAERSGVYEAGEKVGG